MNDCSCVAHRYILYVPAVNGYCFHAQELYSSDTSVEVNALSRIHTSSSNPLNQYTDAHHNIAPIASHQAVGYVELSAVVFSKSPSTYTFIFVQSAVAVTKCRFQSSTLVVDVTFLCGNTAICNCTLCVSSNLNCQALFVVVLSAFSIVGAVQAVTVADVFIQADTVNVFVLVYEVFIILDVPLKLHQLFILPVTQLTLLAVQSLLPTLSLAVVPDVSSSFQ